MSTHSDEDLGKAYYEATIVDPKVWPWSAVPQAARVAWIEAAKAKKFKPSNHE